MMQCYKAFETVLPELHIFFLLFAFPEVAGNTQTASLIYQHAVRELTEIDTYFQEAFDPLPSETDLFFLVWQDDMLNQDTCPPYTLFTLTTPVASWEAYSHYGVWGLHP